MKKTFTNYEIEDLTTEIESVKARLDDCLNSLINNKELDLMQKSFLNEVGILE